MNTTSNRLKLMMLKEGKYTWSVKSVNAQGTKSNASATHSMQVLAAEKLATPVLRPVLKKAVVEAPPAPKLRAPAQAPVLSKPVPGAPQVLPKPMLKPVLQPAKQN